MMLVMALAFTPISLAFMPALAPRCAQQHRAPSPMMAVGIRRFISDLEFLGPCRFVVQGEGAILEAVGAFEGMREDESKNLLTVSNDDNSFECHIRLDQIKGATFAKKEAGPRGTLHIVRLLSAEKKSLLSAILHPETPGGEVEEDAVKFWDSLRAKFGDELDLDLAEPDA